MISSQPALPIIVGAPRSGTTLLRFMLDAHPELAIPPETGFLSLAADFKQTGDALRAEFFQAITRFPPNAPAWQDFQLEAETFRRALELIQPFTVAAGYRAFYQLYAKRFGKTRYGDKTPGYCHFLKTIEAVLPEAHFIHLIRDGRDVTLSLRPLWFSPGKDIATQAAHWMQFVTAAQQQGAECRHYLEVHYENLITQPRATLQQICDFLALPFDQVMLSYHERTPQRLAEHKERFDSHGNLLVSAEQRHLQQKLTTQPPDQSRVQNWKKAMCLEERLCFEACAGELLASLGYETEKR